MPVYVGSHSHPLTDSLKTVAWTPASVNAATTVEQTVTVTGAKIGDMVQVSPPGHTAGIGLGSARVAANDVVRITWINATAGALTPPAGSYKFLLMR